MSAPRRPRLGRWIEQAPPQTDSHIVVFVHGILSDSGTFDPLLSMLAELDTQSTFDLWVFDYDYRQSLHESADQLAAAIVGRAFGERRVDIVGHSMGGLIARLSVLRHKLPHVARIVTLATPNHGTVSGVQLNLLGQMTTLSLRRLDPIYPRASGILDLTNVHNIMREALAAMQATDPTRLHGKSYVSIPAQYYHTLRQAGEAPPSLTMGGLTMARVVFGMITRFRIDLRAVHDGIVEERSNQLFPAPHGSSSEGAYMPNRIEAEQRMLHVTHEAASNCDHVTITASPEIVSLLRAVLLAVTLDANGIDPLLSGPTGRVSLRPLVV